MIDHITIYGSDYERSKKFYVETLAPLGYSIGAEFEMDGMKCIGLADHTGKVEYWLAEGGLSKDFHIALTARSHEEIQRFHEAGIKAGGTDNGKPGPRPEYDENYYAAFILDPDGNNIEAMMR